MNFRRGENACGPLPFPCPFTASLNDNVCAAWRTVGLVNATSVTRLPYRSTNALAVSLFLHRWCPACAYHRVRQSGLAIPPVSKIQRQTKLQ